MGAPLVRQIEKAQPSSESSRQRSADEGQSGCDQKEYEHERQTEILQSRQLLTTSLGDPACHQPWNLHYALNLAPIYSMTVNASALSLKGQSGAEEATLLQQKL